MKIQSGISILFICLALLSAQVAQAQKPVRQRDFEKKINTEEPSSIRGNLRISTESGYPLAVYNPNFAVDAAAPETMARQYLQANMDLFGLKPADLQNLRLHAVRESAAGTTVRLRQFWKNVPVYGAEITITINPQHKVNFVMNSFRYKVDLANVTPTLSAAKARQMVLDYLNVQGKIIQEHNDLIIFQHEQKAGLYYRVNITSETPQGDWEAYVDAKTGAFLKIEDIACYYHDHDHGTPEKPTPPVLIGGTGNVFRPDPLSSATATYGATGYVDGNDANTTQLSSQLQSVALQDITFDGTNYKLQGPYANIVDSESPNKGLFSQPTSTWNFNRFDDAFEAVNCYYHIDLSMRYLNVTLGLAVNPYQYTGGVRYDPSGFNGEDNSHYLGGSGELAFGEGGVDDAEDADVIWHELGHGLHDWFTAGGLSQVNGLSEGCGDYWAASYSRAAGNWTSAQAPYNWTFNWDGHNPFWNGRITNYTAVYPGGLVGAIHTDGQIWATAMMQVWDVVGRNKSDKAFWSGISMTNSSTNQNDAANAVFQAAISLGYTLTELNQVRNIFIARGYTIPAIPAVKYVKANASGANTGTSWANAYTSLQTALEAAVSGDEIWVAAGTYIPTKDQSGNANPGDPRNKTFFINGKNIKIYGGFNGNESAVSDRPWPLAATVLSGEIGASGNADNCYTVFTIFNVNSSSVCDGFTVEGGNNGGSGAGIFVYNGVGNTFNQITLQFNTGGFGGGFFAYGNTTTTVLTNCKFISNTGTTAGGGFHCLDSYPVLYNCTFVNNTSYFGAGVWGQGGTVTVVNCSFSGNLTALGTNGTTANITNSIFWGNGSNFNFNNAPATVTYSIVQGGYTGTGNLSQDPLFVSSTDLRLQACSPAIDFANDAANNTSIDKDNNPRFFQAVPGGSQLDMGAFEYQSTLAAPAAVCKNVSVNLSSFGSANVNASALNNASTGCNLGFTIGGNSSISYNCTNTGPNTATLTVTDNYGRTSTCNATVTVSDVTPPTVNCKSANVNLNAAGTASITTADVFLSGADNCGTVNQVSVTPNSFTCANTGTNTVILTVNDGKGNNKTCIATVTISDVTPPSVTCKNASVNLNAAGSATITTADVYQSGSDNCGTVNQVSVTPNSFSCANIGPNTVTFTANDGKGNTATCSATVTVSDITPPSITCKNASVNLNAAGAASITTADVFQSGSDNCGTVNQVSVTPNSFTCANTGPNTVTFTANDGKGNTATCTATVTVSDVTPPSITCKNASVNLNAAGAASITTADVFQSGSDNCGTVNQVSVTPNSFTCANTGPNTVTFTANDGKGNTATCTATVTVSDVTPPSITCKNASVNLNAAGAASITTADV
ncbi:MAG: HYR domain-containing protein, partial [Bacteroidota bacterium]